MTQESLDFGPQQRVAARAGFVRSIVRRVADDVGLKEVAFAADVSPSYVVQALAGTKSLKIEIVEAALVLADHTMRADLVRALAGDGWVERPALTDAERLARAEALIRREYGADGERKLREEYDR